MIIKSNKDIQFTEAVNPNGSDKPDIVVICGPTAIGKTSLSITAAETFAGEIVGADSMQIYRHMDIGTAKPTHSERSRVPHHMIDVVDPDETYDAARYYREARCCTMDILRKGKVPLVAGGTGFYIKALLYGLCDARPDNPEIRRKLKLQAELKGSIYLHGRLRSCDPESAEQIHPNDTYRVIRALEVFEITGMPMSRYRNRHRFSDEPFNALKIGLHMERDALYERIDTRVDQMMNEGLCEEVRRLMDAGYTGELKPMQALGYRHMIDYIEGRIDMVTAVETLKRDTRRYAKRQLTWFRSDPQIVWCKSWGTSAVLELIKRHLDL